MLTVQLLNAHFMHMCPAHMSIPTELFLGAASINTVLLFLENT